MRCSQSFKAATFLYIPKHMYMYIYLFYLLVLTVIHTQVWFLGFPAYCVICIYIFISQVVYIQTLSLSFQDLLYDNSQVTNALCSVFWVFWFYLFPCISHFVSVTRVQFRHSCSLSVTRLPTQGRQFTQNDTAIKSLYSTNPWSRAARFKYDFFPIYDIET